MENRNIRYRLYPQSRDRAELLKQCLGATRFVWNHFLGENRTQMQAHRADASQPKPNISFFSLGKEFTQFRKRIDWLRELPFAPIRYTLKYQADAWQQCFQSGKGFPQFKSKWYDQDSVSFPLAAFKLVGKSLHLAKIGQVVLSGSNPYPQGEPRMVTITECSGKFYATVCYALETLPKNENGKVVGIDMNVGQFATSAGEIRHKPEVEKLAAKRRRLQRKLARRQGPNRSQGQQPSKRYLLVRSRYAKVSRQLVNRKDNWQHQESRRLANQYQYVVVEALNVKGMTKSAKGTVAQPGKNVKAKSGLNRSILSTGWSGLKQKLKYKTTVIEVDPRWTSQQCNQCGYVDQENRKTQAGFACVACGHSGNADVNAAFNILALGIRAIGHGGRSQRGPDEVPRHLRSQFVN